MQIIDNEENVFNVNEKLQVEGERNSNNFVAELVF